MSEVKTPETKEVEDLLVLKQHRARPFGSNETKLFFPGEKYKQNGMDKLQVLGTGHCTRDLKAEVPVNPKRAAPEKGKAKYGDPNAALVNSVKDLVEVVNKLITKK